MATCSKCHREPDETYALAKCDQCACMLCSECSKLSASEHRGVTVKKRSPCVSYRCTDCVTKVKNPSNTLSTPDIQGTITKAIKTGMEELKLSFIKSFEANTKKVEEQYAKLYSQNRTIIGNTAKLMDHNLGDKPMHTAEATELEELKRALDTLSSKYEAQQAEVLNLKNELARMQHIMMPKQDNAPTHRGITSQQNNPPLHNKNVAVVGQKKTTDKLVASTPQTSIFVSKISLEIAELDLVEYLKNNFGHEQKFTVESLEVKSGEYKAFKIMANKNLEDNLLNPNNWPENIIIKKFTFFRAHHPHSVMPNNRQPKRFNHSNNFQPRR